MKTLLAVLLLLPPWAQATFLDQGDYLLDTETGLDWLDSSYTLGKSYYQAKDAFNEAGGGWRYAYIDEVEQMFGELFPNFVANYIYGQSTSFCFHEAGECAYYIPTYADQLADIDRFQSLWGGATVKYDSGRMTYGMYGDKDVMMGYGNKQSRIYNIGAYDNRDREINPGTEIYGPNGYPGIGAASGQSIFFSWVVREHCDGECERTAFVPEPPIWSLILFGLLFGSASHFFHAVIGTKTKQGKYQRV